MMQVTIQLNTSEEIHAFAQAMMKFAAASVVRPEGFTPNTAVLVPQPEAIGRGNSGEIVYAPAETPVSSKQKARNRRKVAPSAIDMNDAELISPSEIDTNDADDTAPVVVVVVEPVATSATVEDVQDAVTQHLGKKGMASTVAILAEFGIKRAGEVPEDRRAEFVNRLHAEMAA